MAEYAQTWRRKLRLWELVVIAKKESESGMEMSKIYEILDKEMQVRWKLIPCTRKSYLDDVKKILANQYMLVV